MFSVSQTIEKYKYHKFTKYILMVIAVIIILIIYGIYVWVNTETTDNAYINADISNVSSEINGVLTTLLVLNNTKVNQGDLIATIDDRDYVARLNAINASIEALRKNLEILDEKTIIAEINLEQAAQKLNLAQTSFGIISTDFSRTKQLNKEKFASSKALDNAKNIFEKSKNDFSQAKLNLDISKHNLHLLYLEKSAEEKNLKELLENQKIAERALQNTKIIAPVNGILSNSSLEVGNYIAPGRILFSIVQDGTMYIQANFKETQVEKFRSGMKVKVKFDSLPKKTIYGKIRNISPATGSKFALIPADNATGNFTKIVQRVPVLIDFELPNSSNLVPGMSSIVSIRTDQKI